LLDIHAAFFQIYIFVTFLPVIFLVNHRELYLAYIPFLATFSSQK